MSGTMRHRGGVVLACAFALTLAAPARAEISTAELRKEPGYFDFGDLEKFFGGEPTVEIRLTQPLLSMADWAVREDDAELAEALRGLKLVNVNVFQCTDRQALDLREHNDRWSKDLTSKGWEQVVKVKDGAERANVFVKLEESGTASNNGESPMLSGMSIIALDDDDKAIFVNIVGRFEFSKISKLTHHLDLPGVEGMIEKEAQQPSDDSSSTSSPPKSSSSTRKGGSGL